VVASPPGFIPSASKANSPTDQSKILFSIHVNFMKIMSETIMRPVLMNNLIKYSSYKCL
jgi:hypothetical protein